MGLKEDDELASLDEFHCLKCMPPLEKEDSVHELEALMKDEEVQKFD